MKTVPTLIEADDYRAYLRSEFPGLGPTRGRRAEWARVLKCHTSFVSQVLTDRAHLSQEHAVVTADFLQLGTLEKKLLMALVALNRAGTSELQRYWSEELVEIKTRLSRIQERIGVKSEVSPEDQRTYYSHWYYSAIHILAALPKLNHPESMQKRLRITPTQLRQALQFLISRGFIKKAEHGHFEIGKTRIHLPDGSEMLPRHHQNWRIKSYENSEIQSSLDPKSDLRYTAILGISKSDQAEFKQKILKLLSEFEPLVHKSKEEIPVVLLLDLFELK